MRTKFFSVWLGIAILVTLTFCPYQKAEAVGKLSLDECIQKSLANNPAVLASIERKTQAEWKKKVAYRDFFPMLNMDYSYTYLKDATSIDASFVGVGEVSILKHNNYIMGLHIDQPLFTGFKITESYNLADIGLKEAEAGEQLAKLEIVFQTTAAYFDLLRSMKMQKVMDEEVEMLTAHLKDSQSFFDNEKIPLNDLLQSKVHLANAKQGARKAATMTVISKNRLATIMKQPLVNELYVKDEVHTDGFSKVLEEVTAKAFDTRPELAQANYRLEASRKQIRMAKGDYFPMVSFQAAHNRYGGDAWVDGTGTSQLRSPDESMVGVYASWKLMDWGQRSYNVRRAEAQSREVNQKLVEAMDTVALEVKSNYDQAITAFMNIEPAVLAVEQAIENLKMTELRYSNQLSTNTEVLDARSLLTETAFNLYVAIYDYQIWLSGLARSVGVSHWKEI